MEMEERNATKMLKDLMKTLGNAAVEATVSSLPVDDRLMWENSLENLRRLVKKEKILVIGVVIFGAELFKDARDKDNL